MDVISFSIPNRVYVYEKKSVLFYFFFCPDLSNGRGDAVIDETVGGRHISEAPVGRWHSSATVRPSDEKGHESRAALCARYEPAASSVPVRPSLSSTPSDHLDGNHIIFSSDRYARTFREMELRCSRTIFMKTRRLINKKTRDRYSESIRERRLPRAESL